MSAQQPYVLLRGVHSQGMIAEYVAGYGDTRVEALEPIRAELARFAPTLARVTADDGVQVDVPTLPPYRVVLDLDALADDPAAFRAALLTDPTLRAVWDLAIRNGAPFVGVVPS